MSGRLDSALDSGLDLVCIGDFRVHERSAEFENGRYDVSELVEVEEFPLKMAVVASGSYVSIAVKGFHVENKDTGRPFHAILEAGLTWNEVARLHAYLGFLLSQRPA